MNSVTLILDFSSSLISSNFSNSSCFSLRFFLRTLARPAKADSSMLIKVRLIARSTSCLFISAFLALRFLRESFSSSSSFFFRFLAFNFFFFFAGFSSPVTFASFFSFFSFPSSVAFSFLPFSLVFFFSPPALAFFDLRFLPLRGFSSSSTFPTIFSPVEFSFNLFSVSVTNFSSSVETSSCSVFLALSSSAFSSSVCTTASTSVSAGWVSFFPSSTSTVASVSATFSSSGSPLSIIFISFFDSSSVSVSSIAVSSGSTFLLILFL